MRKLSKRQLKVFLCHALDDNLIVYEFFKNLKQDGVDVWFDQEKLLPGQDSQIEIAKAVKDSDVVVVCLTSSSITQKGPIQKEINFALNLVEEQPENTIFIIPCRFDECKVPHRLSRWQSVDLFFHAGSFGGNGYEKLILALSSRAEQLGIGFPREKFSALQNIWNRADAQDGEDLANIDGLLSIANLELSNSGDEDPRHIEKNTQHLMRLLESQLVLLYQQFSDANDEIQQAIVQDFKYYIALKTRSFVGRSHVFRNLNEFINNANYKSGYFFLQGDPGIGKSAIMAQLVVQHGYPHHFNIRSQIDTTRAFLKNICAQLIAVYKLNYNLLPDQVMEDGTIFRNLLFEVSEKIQKSGDRCVIVVDALDEVKQGEISDSLNPLYLPQTLLPGIFFVVSRRRDSQPFIRVSDTPTFTYTLDQDNDLDRADVKLFIEQEIQRDGIKKYIAAQKNLSAGEFVEILLIKSQSNFIYTRLILDDMDAGLYASRNFNNLPDGLINYYQEHWVRMKSLGHQDWVNAKLPVILALTVAKEPITIEQISKYAGVDQQSPSKMMVRTVLNDFDQFIYKRFQPYADTNNTISKERQYRWYHASFFDFIEQKDEIEEGVSLVRAKDRELQVMKMQMRGKYGRKSQPGNGK